MVDDVEVMYIVEWEFGTDRVQLEYRTEQATVAGETVWKCIMPGTTPVDQGFYLKHWENDEYVGKYIVTRTPAKNTGDIREFRVENTSGYYEFVYKLNNAVRSGYTLQGWHNDYVSVAHELDPSADTVRTVRVYTDGLGYVQEAKLITKDSSGKPLEVPLLVGNYIVDSSDADAEGTILIINSSTHFTEFDVKYNTDSPISGKKEGESVALKEKQKPTPGEYNFVGWKVKDRFIKENEYTVSSFYADVNGDIEIKSVASVSPLSSFTVKLLNAEGSVIGTESKNTGGTIELTDVYDAPLGYEWRVRNTTITGSVYTVETSHSNADGVILLKLFAKGAKITTFNVKVDGNLIGTYAPGRVISLGEPAEGELWVIGNHVKVGYTVTSTDANAEGLILLKEVWEEVKEYTVKFETAYGEVPSDVTHKVLGDEVPLQQLTADGHEFLGWKSISGTYESSVYSVSADDANSSKQIKLKAIWENTVLSDKFDIKYISEYGSLSKTFDDGKLEDASVKLPVVTYVGNHKLVGWHIITGTERTIYPTGDYIVTAGDADSEHYIVLKAVWVDIYNVVIKTGNDPAPAVPKLEGDEVPLDYSTIIAWKVSDNVLKKGDSINSSGGGDPFTLNYRAKWQALDYTLHVSQPSRGHIDMYLEDADNPGVSDYVTDDYVNNHYFHYGDKIKLSYNPGSSKVSFVKWEITGQYVISNVNDPEAILVIQGGCSIAVSESSASVIDIMIAYDNGQLNQADKNYTRVFMHDKVTDEYYEAKYVAPLPTMEHYNVKVPYGSDYEVCVRYGWSLPGPDGTCTKLRSFEDAYDEYSLTGDVSVTFGGETTFIYDIISAGFIEKIADDVTDYRDTEYGKITKGSMQTEQPSGTLIPGSWRVWGQGDAVSNYSVNSSHAKRMGSGPYFIVLTGNYSLSNYTVITVDDQGRADFVTGKAEETPIPGSWKVWGQGDVKRSYAVDDADSLPEAAETKFILLVDSRYAGSLSDDYNVITLPSIKYDFLYNENGTMKDSSKQKILDTNYVFVGKATGSTGYPVRVVDTNGTETLSDDVLVAKVSKYQGILRSELAVIAAHNMNINNPDGGTPPVMVEFGPNQTYSTYEGFPWVDGESHKVFAIETDINLAVNWDSNEHIYKTFYLNWVRTDSPADIILQLKRASPPDNYVTADVVMEKDESDAYKGFTVVVDNSLNISSLTTVIEITSTTSAIVETSPGSTIPGDWLLWGTGTPGNYDVDPADAHNGFIVLVDSDVTTLSKTTVIEITSLTEAATVKTNMNTGYEIDAGSWKLWNKGVAGRYFVDYDLISEGVKYNLQKDSAIDVEYPIESVSGYKTNLNPVSLGVGEDISITSENRLHIVLSSNYDNELKIVVRYDKDIAWYALNDMTFGYDEHGHAYNPISYDTGVDEIGSAEWGHKIELPTQFIYNTNERVDIKLWRVVKPVGEGYYIQKDESGKFVYLVSKLDATSTDDFTYSVVNYSGSKGYTKTVQQFGVDIYYINSNSEIYDLNDNKLSIKLYTSRTCTAESEYEIRDGNIPVYSDNRLLFVPLVTERTATVSFVTHYLTFNDGSQRESYTVTVGGYMKDYASSVEGTNKILQFIDDYTGVTSLQYEFKGFYWNGILFDPLTPGSPSSLLILDQDMVWVAKWDPNPSLKNTFTYALEGENADVSASRDASNEPLEQHIPNKLIDDTEITINIQPNSGYTIDIEGTRGELGYMLTETRVFMEVTAPSRPTYNGGEFSSWKMWGTGTPMSPGSTVTESGSDAITGFLVYVADWKEVTDKEFTIVFVKSDGTTEMLRKDVDDTISFTGSLAGSWKLWNDAVKTTSYNVARADAVNGFIVFVQSTVDLGEYTAVFATEHGTVASGSVSDLFFYYTDKSGDKFTKADYGIVYRYESGEWKEYIVTDLTFKDPKYIRQFSGDSKVYRVVRDGTYYEGTPVAYSVTDSSDPKYVKQITGGALSVTYYLDSDAVIYLNDKPVNIVFYKDHAMTTKAVDVSDYTGTIYTAEFTKYETFLEFYSMVKTYKVESGSPTVLKDLDGNAVSLILYNESSRTYVPEDLYSDGSEYLYSKDPAKTYHVKIVDSVKYLYLMEQYSSRYVPVETSFNYYDGGHFQGSQYKDIFGNIWIKTDQDEFKISSVTVYAFDPERTSEEPITIKFDENEEIVSGVYPAQYYFKDQYGNHMVGNHLVNNKIQVLYVDGPSGIEPYSVKYVLKGEYSKILLNGGGVPQYYMKKNGTLMDSSFRIVDYKVYHDSDRNEEYTSDYSITMVNSKYNALTQVRNNSNVYYEDSFGNKYEDWLGEPVKLSGNRGYVWTFFLKEDVDIVIKMKKISYSINFIINGERVKPSDLNAVSTISSKAASSTEYYGVDIPQYTIVAFDGPMGERDITWYTDPQYTHEYDVHNNNVVLSPSEFVVDVKLPEALVDSANEPKTFVGWKFWSSVDVLDPESEQTLNTNNDNKWKSLAGDKNNYFYTFVADWSTNTTGTYTVIFASNQGTFTNGNLIRADSGEITVPVLDDKTGLRGWKLWNTNEFTLSADATTYEINEDHDVEGFIIFVADWGEDLTKASNVVYASECGKVPVMESVRKYQFMSDQNISLYAHMGLYVLYLHNFYDDADKTIKYELTVDENNRIKLPAEHYELGDYVFLGWAEERNDPSDGNKLKRFYTYTPEEEIYAVKLDDQINLFPYYVSDGSEIKFYDGKQSNLKVSMDDVLSEKQHVPSATVLSVKYSTEPIGPGEGEDTPPASASGIHVNTYYVYYYATIKTPLGEEPSDESYGNTKTEYAFANKATLKILPVDAYVVAPSVYDRYDGTAKTVTAEDITVVGLMDDDYTVSLENDGDYGTTRTEQGVTLTHVNINWKGFITLVDSSYAGGLNGYTVVWISSDNSVKTVTGLTLGGTNTQSGAWKLWGAGDDLPQVAGNTTYTVREEDAGTNKFIILIASDYHFRGLDLITITNGTTGTSSPAQSEGTIVAGTWKLWGLDEVTGYAISSSNAQGYMYDPSFDPEKMNYEVDYNLRFIDGSIAIYPEETSKNEHAGHI